MGIQRSIIHNNVFLWFGKQIKKHWVFLLIFAISVLVLRRSENTRHNKKSRNPRPKQQKKRAESERKLKKKLNKLWSDMIPLIREPPSRERIYLLGIAVFFYSFFVVNRASEKHTQNTELFMQKKPSYKKKLVCDPRQYKPVLYAF